MTNSICRRIGVTAVLAALATPPLAAQYEDETAYAELVDRVKHEYLSLGVLLQSVADFQPVRNVTGTNGFSIANFRVALFGELDKRFGYFLQTNFAASPAILDASMYYRFGPQLTVRAGQFKVPFSREFLTSAASIDFVNRAQAVSALAPGRQVGVSIAATNRSGTAGLDAGVFNGNSARVNANDGDDLLYAVRARATFPGGTDAALRLDAGVNFAYSRDERVTVPGLFIDFAGRRTLVGVDAKGTVGPYSASGEVIVASLDPELGETRTPWGFHLTAGYMLTDKMQALVRFDGLETDLLGGRQDFLVLGFNAWPTAVTEFQVNYLVNPGDASPEHHQLLVNFQFGF